LQKAVVRPNTCMHLPAMRAAPRYQHQPQLGISLSFLVAALLLVVLPQQVQSETAFNKKTTVPYRLGNFGVVPTVTPPNKLFDPFAEFVGRHKRLLRFIAFCYGTRIAVVSIAEDTWKLDRTKAKTLVKSYTKVVRKRTARARTIREWTGQGYSPRLVWLFGVMLRGFIHSTALFKIFEPTIGWGAGSVLAAKFAKREWIPVVILGWFSSAHYWKYLMGVNGPPPPKENEFDGVPIVIQGLRLF